MTHAVDYPSLTESEISPWKHSLQYLLQCYINTVFYPEIEARTPCDKQPCYTAQNTSSANFPTVLQANHEVILPIQGISEISSITEPGIYLEGAKHALFSHNYTVHNNYTVEEVDVHTHQLLG